MKSDSQCFTLSEQARLLWGKSGYNGEWLWLPLFVHMYDSWGVAKKLWDTCLPPGTKNIMVRAMGGNSDRAGRCVCLFAALHDIGKATPAFQTRGRDTSGSYSFVDELERAGFRVHDKSTWSQNVYHPIGSQIILERYLTNQYGWSPGLARSYACIVGSHHGVFFFDDSSDNSDGIGTSKFYNQTWQRVQDELIGHMVSRAELDTGDFHYFGKQKPLPVVVASICAGFVMMTDWIASNQDFFSLFSVNEPGPFYDLNREEDHQTVLEQRLESAWKRLALMPSWKPQLSGKLSENKFYSERFSFPGGAELRPIQSAALDIARKAEDPGLIIIEAPMGEGKTEAALAAAEVLAERTGRGGVAVALPTMATTDAMFSRVNRWLKNVPYQGSNAGKSMYLAHGKARLNEEFQGIMTVSECIRSAGNMNQGSCGSFSTEQVVVSDWMCGRKKGMLANFVVCTVDQILMGALRMKHLSLRQLALVNKVIIIDECHAYDVYMQCYLERILEWLGYWHTPVILLSATLPKQQRHTMMEAYCQGKKASRGEFPKKSSASSSEDDLPSSYPLLSYTFGQRQLTKSVESSGRTVDISLNILSDDDASLVDLLVSSLVEGGYAGVICNTVSRAQHVASLLERVFEDDVVRLVHACFTGFDRVQKEKELCNLLGPDSTRANERCTKKLIVVGTQILEQSLDIDFDLLVTDIAPVDLIMQRLGRLHRHHRGDYNEGRVKNLRKAQCFIRGIESWTSTGPKFSEGIQCVYASASLIESLAVLELYLSEVSLTLPSDIAPKVQHAYYHTDLDDEERLDEQITMFARENLPELWHEMYREACKKRIGNEKKKREYAEHSLLTSAADSCKNERTLNNLSIRGLGFADVDDNDARLQKAVRDIQETVEVVLLCRREGCMCLFPWIGDISHNVELGAKVSIEEPIAENIAQVVAQSTVRLPLEMSRNSDELETLINELNERNCDFKKVRQNLRWLAKKPVLVLEQVRGDCGGKENEEFCAELDEWYVQYSRKCGLSVSPKEKGGVSDQSSEG